MEFHNYAAPTFKKVLHIRRSHLLSLTATLERKDGLHTMLEAVSPVIYNLPIKQARKSGFVSDYKIYNLGVEMAGETKAEYARAHHGFNSLFRRFNYDFPTAMACMTGDTFCVDQMAQHQGITPKEVKGMAAAWGALMRKRKSLIHNAPVKIDMIERLLPKLEGKTIIFNQTNAFCDQIAERLDGAYAFHSGLKSQMVDGVKMPPKKYKEWLLKSFADPNGIDTIVCGKALEEGVSIDTIQNIILGAYTSDVRSFVQKLGRAVRFIPGKTAKMICLYIKPFSIGDNSVSSKEEAWLRASQKGNRDSVEWVNTIDEIVSNKSVSF